MLVFRENKSRKNGCINENSFDRKVNNYIKDYTGLEDFNQVRSFLLNKIYKTIPELRLITRPEAVHSALEWFFNPDGSPKNEDYIAPFRQILQAIKEKAPDELNKMGYVMQFMEPQSYCKQYGYLVKHEKNTVSSSNSQKERTTPTGYHIRRIDSFDEAYGGGMSEWCIGRDPEWWDEMVGYTATVYLVWNKDVDMDYEETYGSFTYEDGEEFEAGYDEYFMDMSYTNALRDPNYGRFGSGKYPYDRYGLSKLVVIAHENGMFEVWSRYNLTEGKDGDFLTKNQLSELIGEPCGNVFPYVEKNISEKTNKKLTTEGNIMRYSLSESKLRSIINKAVRRALTESWDNWRPDDDDDISDYSLGVVAKLSVRYGVPDLSKEVIDKLETIKDEYIEFSDTYVNVMVKKVEVVFDPEYEDYDVYIDVGITAPDMPLERVEDETEEALWWWFENVTGVNVMSGFAWEEEDIVFDRRTKHPRF